MLNTKRPDVILQTGDFGWWRPYHNTTVMQSTPGCCKKEKNWNQYGIKLHGDSKLYFCDGNHEHHDDLDKSFKEPINEVMSNVFFMRRGSTLELPNGKTVLFIGGADSIDSRYRTLGYDWFPQELISNKDLDNLLDCHVDWVISHTCPNYFKMAEMYEKVDPSQYALDYVFDKYHPEKWWFGHFHRHQKGIYNGCEWIALNCMGNTGGYEIYEI